MDNYGWTDLLGQSGSAPDERLACGVLLLGPELYYPPHQHEAEEMYVPLSGTAQWSQGRPRLAAASAGQHDSLSAA